jgi:hypothetical protein
LFGIGAQVDPANSCGFNLGGTQFDAARIELIIPAAGNSRLTGADTIADLTDFCCCGAGAGGGTGSKNFGVGCMAVSAICGLSVVGIGSAGVAACCRACSSKCVKCVKNCFLASAVWLRANPALMIQLTDFVCRPGSGSGLASHCEPG